MPRLAVVIPTLDEERTIDACLESIGEDRELEVVVSDGGSRDGTRRLAAAGGAAVIEGPPGRGGQLNRGAAAATSRHLLFLHADCRLPPGWLADLARALADSEVALACFRLRTEAADDRKPTLPGRLLLRTLDIGSRWGRLPYGDQGFGVRREVFAAVGGFPDIPLMEDVVFARACARRGRICRIPSEVRTTARRTARFPVRTRVMFFIFPTLFRLGVSPETLARWYGTAR